MAKVLTKCLFQMSEKERTVPVMLQRLSDIKSTLNRVSAIMKTITPERMARNGTYWHNTLDGWGDHLRQLGNELVLIQTELSKHIIDS